MCQIHSGKQNECFLYRLEFSNTVLANALLKWIPIFLACDPLNRNYASPKVNINVSNMGKRRSPKCQPGIVRTCAPSTMLGWFDSCQETRTDLNGIHFMQVLKKKQDCVWVWTFVLVLWNKAICLLSFSLVLCMHFYQRDYCALFE